MSSLKLVSEGTSRLSQLRDFMRGVDYLASKRKLHALAEVLDAVGETLPALTTQHDREQWAEFVRWAAREVGGFDG